MATREIPRSEWKTFCDIFSRQHEGWLSTVEVVGMDLGDQIEGNELPLDGVSADTKGSDPDAIEITLGNTPSEHVTRIVHNAARLLLELNETGAHEALEIESADGDRVILKFRTAQYPEALDGVVDKPRTRRAGGS